MGLDMYLERVYADTPKEAREKIKSMEQRYENVVYTPEKNMSPDLCKQMLTDMAHRNIFIRPTGECNIYLEPTEELMYWRKANAIHNWFVKNVQDGVDDCARHLVTKADLEHLLFDCKQAVLSKEPAAHMPTQDGFFFGGTDYGEYYQYQLERTITFLEDFIKTIMNPHFVMFYVSSW